MPLPPHGVRTLNRFSQITVSKKNTADRYGSGFNEHLRRWGTRPAAPGMPYPPPLASLHSAALGVPLAL